MKEYEERVVEINRISKTVQGGRHMRFSALVVIGDKKGKYGFAMEKSGEVPDAIKKSLETAKHNMYHIHIVKKGFTIAHEVMGKYGATKVYLKPAPAGTGIIAGGPVRAILELSGLRNVVSKVYGARASINVIRATHNAIGQLKSYFDVQALRGKLQEVKK
ncbi:MAG: 30S ribosomal protein S5 [Bacilli bacterium]|nr:30S ribosomal protein S5 [Bacilli bacterium]